MPRSVAVRIKRPKPWRSRRTASGTAYSWKGVLVEAAASSVERVGWNGEGEACDEEADELLAGEIDPFPVAAGAEEKRARVGTKVAQVAAPAALALLENGKTG